MFTDYMGIEQDTTGMPKHLKQTLNSHICYGGGGGGQSSTTQSGIDPEFKPQLKRVIDDVTDRYEREVGGEQATLAQDAGVREALGQQDALARQVLAGGLGQDAIDRDLANLQGQQIAGGLGTLGSARADRARQAGLADRALNLRTADIEARRQAAQGLTATQEARRGLDQQIIDAPHTSAQRYFGYLGNVGQQQTTNQGGGGK